MPLGIKLSWLCPFLVMGFLLGVVIHEASHELLAWILGVTLVWHDGGTWNVGTGATTEQCQTIAFAGQIGTLVFAIGLLLAGFRFRDSYVGRTILYLSFGMLLLFLYTIMNWYWL
jgi:hypothetical protein